MDILHKTSRSYDSVQMKPDLRNHVRRQCVVTQMIVCHVARRRATSLSLKRRGENDNYKKPESPFINASRVRGARALATHTINLSAVMTLHVATGD